MCFRGNNSKSMGWVINSPSDADLDEHLAHVLATAQKQLSTLSRSLSFLAGARLATDRDVPVYEDNPPPFKQRDVGLAQVLRLDCLSVIPDQEFGRLDSLFQEIVARHPLSRDDEPKVTGESQVSQVKIPRLWSVLPRLLPRTVRERIYEPAELELAEEFLVAQTARPGWRVTAAYTYRGALLVARVGAGAAREKARKVVLALVTRAVGEREYRTLRAWWAVLRGRLP